MAPIRTFIAIKIPQDILTQIAVLLSGLKTLGGRITWVKPENMHLTLKFLGKTDPVQVKNISEKLSQLVLSFNRFEIKFKGLGAFPNFRRPKIFWIGTVGDNSTLIQLANKIDRQMSEFGFKPENRRFSAHLTIGRVRDQGGIEPIINLLQKEENFTAGEFIVKQVFFIKSELTQQGPIYTTLEKLTIN